MSQDADQPKQRRSRRDCLAMPPWLDARHLEAATQWPLGRMALRRCVGECWTDCIVHLIEPIRLGGRYSARRVRFDGSVFWITHNLREVTIRGEGALMVLEQVTHIYGLDDESDAMHDARLRLLTR